MSMLGLLDYFGDTASRATYRYFARAGYEMCRLVAKATVTANAKNLKGRVDRSADFIPHPWKDLTQNEQELWIGAAKHVLTKIRNQEFSEQDSEERTG